MCEKLDHEKLRRQFPQGYDLIGEDKHPNFGGYLVVGKPAKTVEEWLARHSRGKVPEGPTESR